jgi:hypothetical protein
MMPDVSKFRVFEEEAGFGKPGATQVLRSKAPLFDFTVLRIRITVISQRGSVSDDKFGRKHVLSAVVLSDCKGACVASCC